MPNTRSWSCFLLFLMVTATAMAGGPFLDLGVDDALKRAGEEEKVVFIDFFATWCGPCKELDKTTFADEKVIAWLGEHTVPLKVDTDQDKATAQRYRVNMMPTLLFLRADGTELNRVQGFQTSEQFLAMAGDVVKRPETDAVTRAREELATGNWPEAMARHKLGTALLMAGGKDEALAEYQKALDSLGTDFMSQRYRPRLVNDICDMAGDHPPALKVVAAEREKLVAKLESGQGDREDLERIIDIDLGLNQKEKTLELYDRLKEKGDVPAEVLEGFCTVCRQALLERRDYEALSLLCRWSLVGTLNRIDLLRRQRDLAAGDSGGRPTSAQDKASHLASMEERTIRRVAEDYEITCGLGKATDSLVIAEKLLELCPDAAAHHALAAHGLASGNPREADLEYARKAVELDDTDSPDMRETLAALQAHFGGAAGIPPVNAE